MPPRYLQHLLQVTARYLLIPCLAILLPSLSAKSVAGVITLNNGDKINGELIKLEGEAIHWASENFGTLVIATTKVSKLETPTALKVNGHDDSCTLTGMSRGRMLFTCDDNQEYSNELRIVKTLLPYTHYIEGDYSYRGKIRAAGNFADGNTRQMDWDIDTDTEFRRGDYRHRMAAVYDSRSSNDDPADEIFDLQYQLDVFFHERWFSYNKISYGIIEPKNIDERISIGSGLGYQLWDTDLTALSVVTGLDYIKRSFGNVEDSAAVNNDSNDESMNWRGGTDFRYRLPLSIGFFHRNEILWSLSDSSDWEFDSETGILVPLGSGLFTDLKIEYDYDNSLRSDLTEKSDTRIKVGLGYEW